MKNLIMIVHASFKEDLADKLRSLDVVQGFTFSHAEGHGSQVENDPFLSTRDKVVGYTPRVRVDILLEDDDVAKVLDILRDENAGKTSLGGIYWVTAVEEHGRM